MSHDVTISRTPILLAPVVAIGLSFFVGNLDATVVNVATTQIGLDLNAPTAALAWMVNGFVLALAALLLFSSDLAGRFGARRLYVWGLAAFTAASLLAGFATTAPVLIGARVIQGIGAALFQPAGLVLLAMSYPDAAVRQRMIGLWAAMGAAAAALGPMIGGFIVAGWGWRWVFWINLPIGVVAIWLSVTVLPSSTGIRRRIPLIGHALFALSVVAGAVALMQGPETGWSAPVPLAAIAVSILALVLFIWWQRQADNEVYPGRILRNREFTLANAVGILMNVGLFGGVFFVSILLQQTMGSDPLTAGLQLLPMMAVFVLGNLTYSRLSGSLTPRQSILLGLGAATIAVGALTLASTQDFSYLWFAVCLATAHLGLGLGSPAMTAAMLNSVDTRDTGLAGAVLNVNRQIGSLLGVAIAAGLLTAVGQAAAAPAMFGISTLGYALAVVAGYLLHASPQKTGSP